MNRPTLAPAGSHVLDGLAVLDADMVLFHAERIKAAAGILDDVQRAHIYQGKGEELTVTVLLDALTAFLLEESGSIEAAARKELKGPSSPGRTQAGPP